MIKDIAVATMTLARSSAEEQTLQEALRELSAHGRRVAVADGGSSDRFVDALRRLPLVDVISITRGAGLALQIRAALRLAQSWNSRRILYTEPDKLDFFGDHLEMFLSSAMDDYAGAGVVIAARSRESFATYPASQQYAETVVNKLCGDATGLVTDYTYGPFLCDPTLLNELHAVPASIGWGWRPFVFARASVTAKRLASIVGDYSCPGSERDDSSREWQHRLRQLSENLSGLALACQMEGEPVRG